jgi:hypothetical protein
MSTGDCCRICDIRMGRDGQMRWLVVKMLPEEPWPKL